jgi:hypothetical protein
MRFSRQWALRSWSNRMCILSLVDVSLCFWGNCYLHIQEKRCISSNLKMDTVASPEILVHIYQTKWHHTIKDHDIIITDVQNISTTVISTVNCLKLQHVPRITLIGMHNIIDNHEYVWGRCNILSFNATCRYTEMWLLFQHRSIRNYTLHIIDCHGTQQPPAKNILL